MNILQKVLEMMRSHKKWTFIIRISQINYEHK